VRIFIKKLYLRFNVILMRLISVVSDIIKVVLFSRFGLNSKHSSKSNNIYILANGPGTDSFLKNTPIDFGSSSVMCMNFALLDVQILKLRPDSYVVADPNVFGRDDILDIVYDKYLVLVSILNELDWELSLYVPYDFRSGRFVRDVHNEKIKIHWFNRTTLESLGWPLLFLYRLGLGLPKAESVIIAALGLAILNRPETVKLVGVEHDWIHNLRVNENNEVHYLLKHFYKEDKEYKSDLTVSGFMLSQHRLFRSHETIRYLAEKQDVKVINMTRTSLIDCYERN
jgi:hypothetical protein